jgi:hypothetical protein
LGEEAVPEVDGELRVSAAEASNEVILECANGPFSSIAAMGTRGHQLVVNVSCHKEVFEGGAAFIVKLVEDWSVASMH